MYILTMGMHCVTALKTQETSCLSSTHAACYIIALLFLVLCAAGSAHILFLSFLSTAES